ncbi:MAG: ABC transporter substrate-binding protein [Acidimicrobiales bacterium]|nr:ABC transporter substrate-binding protein [Acidimicrobiales bacterium]
MSKRIVAVALAPLALLAAACGSDDSTSSSTTTTAETAGGTGGTGGAGGDCALDSPLKIGFAADLGELGAFSDQPGSEAAKVQVDLLNKAGGVGGKPIEYVVKDIQGDPAATQRAAQELLDDGVSALIGPPFSNTGIPLLDTVNGKAPIIYMASTDPQLADPDRGGFLASFSDPVQSAAAAEFAAEQGKKAAVLFSSPEDVYFSGNPKYFAEAFEEAGGTVVRDFSFSLADEDFSTQVNELAKLSPAPDVLFTPMVMPQIGTLLQQIKAAGMEDLTVIGADSFDATVVWSAGPVANGVYFAAHTFPTDDNGVQALLDAASAAGVEIETISFGALAADAVQILAHAAETACSTDGPTLIETINTIKDLEVTTGTVTYDGTAGVPEKDVSILTVTDEKPALETTLRPAFIPAD